MTQFLPHDLSFQESYMNVDSHFGGNLKHILMHSLAFDVGSQLVATEKS